MSHCIIPIPKAEREQQLQLLTAAGIDAQDFDDPAKETGGLLVADQQSAKALKLLGLKATEETPSSYKGIVIFSVEAHKEAAPAASGKVECRSWTGPDNQPFFACLFKPLLPTLNSGGRKVNIIVHDRKATLAEPIHDGDFHIHLWSSAKGERVRTPPQRLWGQEVDHRKYAFGPSGLGVPIIDDRLFEVAELVGDDNLYVHYGINQVGGKREPAIFARIIQEVVAMLPLDATERQARFTAARDTIRQGARSIYVTKCTVDLSKKVDEKRKASAAARADLEAKQQELTEAIRLARAAEEEHASLLSRQGEQDTRLAQEYDHLVQAPGVKDVLITDDTVIVFTTLMCAVDPRTQKVHEIGEFRIDLQLNGGDDSIRFFNLTRLGTALDHRVSGGIRTMQAPHVTEDGKPCLGTLKEVMPKLLAEYRFTEATLMAIKFLQQANVVDDLWGQSIDRWPLAQPAEKEVQE